MFHQPRFEVPGTSRRDFALDFTLLFNALTWSYMIILLVESVSLNTTLESAFNTVFYVAASGAGLSGAFLSEKMKRTNLLYLWMILGLVGSSLLTLLKNLMPLHVSIISILLGVSFGLGMPSSLAYLADNSKVENRARISALILLTANISTLPLAVLFMTLDPVLNAVILTVWRAAGLIGFAWLKPKEESKTKEKKKVPLTSILRERSFFLYLLPWVMFCLIDASEKPLLLNIMSQDLQRLMFTLEPIIAVVFTFISGFLADKIGRKRVTMYGFVSLGVAYAIVGLAPMTNVAWYFYFVVDGAAGGILLTMFLLTLWGDVSQTGSREKYYAVGNFPFLIRSAMSLLFINLTLSAPVNTAFSLASFFLFLAVLPLMYAPETLSEKKIELRRLKGYVEQAKKFTEKYTKTDSSKS